jgi:septum site-determining protein MinC
MKNKKTIEFKGTVATFSTLTVTLRSAQFDELKKDLYALCGDTPDFFNEDVAVLDAAALPGHGVDFDWARLVALLRSVRLNPVAVRHAAAEAEAEIRRAGLNLAEEIEVASRKGAVEPSPPPLADATPASPAELPVTLPAQPELELTPPSAPPATAAAAPAPGAAPATAPISVAVPTLVIDRPLRSGQQIYARNADLVVLAMVNPGAEVMADGNIHVYAPLRGRALAGANGNQNARILTTCFQAELVSIGGVYLPLEPGMPQEVSGKPAQVRLGDNAAGKQTLLIEALKIV